MTKTNDANELRLWAEDTHAVAGHNAKSALLSRVADRLEKQEAAVKALRGALQAINLCQFNSMSSRSEMVRLAAEALKNTEDL